MKRIPIIEKPSLEEIRRYKGCVPCFGEAERIIEEELEKGNFLSLIGDVGFMPSETVVVIDFTGEPMCDYPDIKEKKYDNGGGYKYLVRGDNKGGLEINFGRRKK